MCKYHNLLVEQSQARSVTQCEHGTIHLRWDHLTISLSSTDFCTLAHQVLDGYAATQSTAGKMRLSMEHSTVEFAADDFYPLLALFEQALDRLEAGIFPSQAVRQPTPFLINDHLN